MAKKKMKTEEKIDIRMRVDGDLYERVQKAADKEGLPVAAWIRSLVLRELRRREKEGDE